MKGKGGKRRRSLGMTAANPRDQWDTREVANMEETENQSLQGVGMISTEGSLVWGLSGMV